MKSEAKTLGRSTSLNDEAWFKAHPRRQFRKRPPTVAELEASGAVDLIGGYRALAIVAHVPGYPVRIEHARLPDNDAYLGAYAFLVDLKIAFGRLGPISHDEIEAAIPVVANRGKSVS